MAEEEENQEKTEEEGGQKELGVDDWRDEDAGLAKDSGAAAGEPRRAADVDREPRNPVTALAARVAGVLNVTTSGIFTSKEIYGLQNKRGPRSIQRVVARLPTTEARRTRQRTTVWYA